MATKKEKEITSYYVSKFRIHPTKHQQEFLKRRFDVAYAFMRRGYKAMRSYLIKLITHKSFIELKERMYTAYKAKDWDALHKMQYEELTLLLAKFQMPTKPINMGTSKNAKKTNNEEVKPGIFRGPQYGGYLLRGHIHVYNIMTKQCLGAVILNVLANRYSSCLEIIKKAMQNPCVKPEPKYYLKHLKHYRYMDFTSLCTNSACVMSIDPKTLDFVWALQRKNYSTAKPNAPNTINVKQSIRLRRDLADIYFLDLARVVNEDLINGTRKLRYVQLVREMHCGKWYYYVHCTIDGVAPKNRPAEVLQAQFSEDELLKYFDAEELTTRFRTEAQKKKYYALFDKDPIDKDTVTGVDLGPSTIACCSSNGAIYADLMRPEYTKTQEKLKQVQRRLDDSVRSTTPENFNPDGTIKTRGRVRWRYSEHAQELRRLYTDLNRRDKATRKCNNNALANRIVRLGASVVTEPSNQKQLQKKAELKKDAKGRYKKRKRFGHTIRLCSPATLLSSIKQKCAYAGRVMKEVNCKKYRASQYNPFTNEYTKHGLRDRVIEIHGHRIQRDLWSAYLLAHPDLTSKDLSQIDREACIRDFDEFCKQHNAVIEDSKNPESERTVCFGKTRKSCFGSW